MEINIDYIEILKKGININIDQQNMKMRRSNCDYIEILKKAININYSNSRTAATIC